MRKTWEEIIAIRPELDWTRAIADEFKLDDNETIRQKLQERSLNFGILMPQQIRDNNFGSILRSANSFGARNMFYFGSRRWDKRSSCGAHTYLVPVHLPDMEAVKALAKDYKLVALECNVEGRECIDLIKYQWDFERPTLMVLGEEGQGICSELLAECEDIVFIRGRGSVRSLNISCAASIMMHDYTVKLEGGR